MGKKYDTIVIGGGHNGLTTATVLANTGQKVLLLERRSVLGGIAAGEEFHPGYWSDGLIHETGMLRGQVINELSLKNHGLITSGERAPVAILGKEGKCITLFADEARTVKSISKYSKKDAEAYTEYRSFISKITPLIRDIMDQAPPDIVTMGNKDLWQLVKKGLGLKKLGKATMMEFLKVAPMSVQDFLDERFETEFLKAGMAGPAICASFTSPRSAYTALNLLLWECLACEEVIGGPQALITSLETAARHAGVEVVLNSHVKQIQLDKNRNVIGARLENGEEFEAQNVAASCSPRETFFELLEPNHIEYSLEHGIEHFRSRGTTAKLMLALDKPLQLNGLESEVHFARTGNSWLEMEKAFDPVKYKNFSSEPVLDIYLDGKAPDSHTSVSILIHYASYELEGGWSDSSKKELMENTINTLEKYSSTVRKLIIGSEILSPLDLEERYNLPFGHIFHGEHAVDQILTRPIPSCMRYKTPINGLYLCGSGSHPGGGITGMPGLLGARVLLKS